VWVTPVVIAANVLAFGAMAASEGFTNDPSLEVMIRWGANYAPREQQGEWWRLLTAAFTHFGPVHLALNMWCLAVVGPLVERLCGNAGFAVLYLLAAVGGSLASMGWDPTVVSAGASGAVFGVSGALFGFVSRAEGTIPPAVLGRMRGGAVAFVGYNLVAGFFLPDIDNAGHVGGLLVGLLAGLAVGRPIGPDFDRDRGRRAVAALLGGGVLLALAFLPVRHRIADVPDWPAEFERLGQLEQAGTSAYDAATGRASRREITDAQLAELIERDVLPRWREGERQINGWKRVPTGLQTAIDLLRDYFRAWRECCTLVVRALRHGDGAAAERAAEKMRETQRLRDRLAAEWSRGWR
jgi:rhomboid protease GluP